MALLSLHIVLDLTIHGSVALLAVASVSWLLLVHRPVHRSVLIVAFAIMALVAVAKPPLGTDLWSYQAYGRVLTEYGDNPYTAVPGAYPGDAVMARVSSLYIELPSAYGPVFVGAAGVIAVATGAGELAGRLGWQLVGALAVAATALVLHRAGRSSRAIAAFVFHPLVAYQLIHLAHNDALVGLAILGGVLLAARDRTTAASLLLASAALIKAPSGVAWLALIAWLVVNRRRRDAGVAIASAAALAVITLLPFGISTALGPMLDSRGTSNATSIWNAVRGDWATFVWRPIRGVDATAGSWVSALALLLPVLVALAATYALRSRPVHEAVTVALLAWLALSLYPSVWYFAWVLPLAALWPLRERVAIGAYVALCQIVSQTWLFPVAAGLAGDGELGLVDRLGAPLLGIGSVAGSALIVWLAGNRRQIGGPSAL
jgi:hypothetical protein